MLKEITVGLLPLRFLHAVQCTLSCIACLDCSVLRYNNYEDFLCFVVNCDTKKHLKSIFISELFAFK